MCYVYIIYSPTLDKYYIGQSINPQERLTQHNCGFYRGSFTKTANDWKLALTISCADKTSAIKLEKYIKSMKSKVYIRRLINNPLKIEKLTKKVL